MLEFAAWLAGTAMGHGVAHRAAQRVAHRVADRVAMSARVFPASRTMQFAADTGGATACI